MRTYYKGALTIHTYKWNEIRKLYVAKAERKGRTEAEVDEIICWLTGYTKPALLAMGDDVDMTAFFNNAPKLNPNRALIKGSVCGVKIETIDEPITKEIRYLDKLIDELAKGKLMEKILRK